MDSILKVVMFGLIATLLIKVVDEVKAKDIGYIIRVVTVTIFMILIITQLNTVYEIIRDLAAKIHMDETYLNIVLKVIGIAYLAEFGAQLCEDAGEKAIAGKIQWVGKMMIFVSSTPVILALIHLITDLI